MDLIRESDPALYASLLFLPPSQRMDAAVLHAFHQEIARIQYIVREPMSGEIRLQWWRDIIKGERSGEAKANPLADALQKVIANNNLPPDGFSRYLDARVFDVYNDPMPDLATLEGYFGETESFIFQMVALCGGAEQTSKLADACGHAGCAAGLVRALMRMAHDRDRQRCYPPADLLNAAGLTTEDWLSGTTHAHKVAVEAFMGLAKDHYQKARAAITSLPKQERAAFLPLALAKQQLKYISKAGPDAVLAGNIPVASPLSFQMSLWKSVLFGI